MTLATSLTEQYGLSTSLMLLLL